LVPAFMRGTCNARNTAQVASADARARKARSN